MPKMKTNRGAAKRFKKTANGYKCSCAGHNHILTKKNSKRKSRLVSKKMVSKNDRDAVARMLGDE